MRILNSAKTNFLSIFVIILCSYTLYTTAVIREFSHKEEIDHGKVLPRIWDSKAYDDGTMVIRIVRKNPTTTIDNYLCFYEVFSLRIIDFDGTVVEKNLKLDIQSFNYCVFQMVSGDPSTYIEWGMVIDYDGNVSSRTPIGLPFINNALQIVVPSDQFVVNINREKGFMRYAINQNNNIDWKQFRIEPDGAIIGLTSGELVLDVLDKVESAIVIRTVDEGYAIVFTNSTVTLNATNPLLPKGQLYISPIGYNQNPSPSSLIYQTTAPNLAFTALFCDITFVEVGNVCILTILQTDPTGTLPSESFYIKIKFLSSGSVLSFQSQVANSLTLPVGNANMDWVVNSLAFGGYLLTNTAPTGPNQFSIYGYLIDEHNSAPIPWEFLEPEPIGIKGVYQILRNNTLLVSQLETDNSWRFQVIDLPKFDGNKDKGYFNFNVESTYPAINSTISPDIQNITINFYDPVELSDGKLTIYQLIDNQPNLRQYITESSCTVNNNGKTVNAKILDSTFSVSGGIYYIKMDNNFVRDKTYKESLLGIRDNIWSFNVKQKEVPFALSMNGLLRLTPDGTKYFDSLPQEQQSNFFNILLDDLSNAIPVSRSCLTSNEKTQLDPSVNENQYLISIGVEETRVNNDISVETVVNNINTMVKSKDLTLINNGQASKYLDQSYGFIPTLNLWEKYKYNLLGILLIIGLLIVLFFFARSRNSNGNNIAILQLGLIIFDLVIDITFVNNNAKDIPVLYFPSIVFVTVPIGINTILAFYLITQENTRPKFLEWFMAHKKVASIFTILASADIETLSILHSNLAGFSFFNAPFSDDAKSKIFWGTCLNIFIEDIPQVIIQILYKLYTVSYDIIPLLTLISSVVNLTINIIGRLYQATIHLRHSKHSNHLYNDMNDLDIPITSI
ncbi:uncharacterized protein OCT59_009094 [Rhizophagus irregularis]|uniref:uncharacterized protein n=1 Tax=Rhizophagus irregularis TaxID=588596 RepID=UPI000CC4CE17|nr:hypothetical protein OCT59_009094 [Rhizophagus irregularis]GBC24435.1 hypothetical protein GLOIN_2v1822036 [Rhizophagus irregularis DAOM 181602=DAOM 197198]